MSAPTPACELRDKLEVHVEARGARKAFDGMVVGAPKADGLHVDVRSSWSGGVYLVRVEDVRVR